MRLTRHPPRFATTWANGPMGPLSGAGRDESLGATGGIRRGYHDPKSGRQPVYLTPAESIRPRAGRAGGAASLAKRTLSRCATRRDNGLRTPAPTARLFPRWSAGPRKPHRGHSGRNREEHGESETAPDPVIPSPDDDGNARACRSTLRDEHAPRGSHTSHNPPLPAPSATRHVPIAPTGRSHTGPPSGESEEGTLAAYSTQQTQRDTPF